VTHRAAFDPDPAGIAGAERLAHHLEARHRRTTVLRLERGDLNEQCIRHGLGWPHALAAAITQTRHLERPGLTRAM
jgi:hypothetical protein